MTPEPKPAKAIILAPAVSPALVADIRRLIESARQRTAAAVNAELTMLYWHIGRRVHAEVLKGQRGEYGGRIVASLAERLTSEYGKGWGERQLRYCLRVAETFPDERIVNTLCSQFSWSHLRLLMLIDDPLKRDFYIEIARLERWSVRQLQERVQSMLFERTAISRKPEKTIQRDLAGKLTAKREKLLRAVLTQKDEAARPVIKKISPASKVKPDPLHGLYAVTIDSKPRTVEYEPDTDQRDTEQVPLLEDGGIEAFFRREVLPHVPDAWIDQTKTQVGYEISFTRHFYKPTLLRSLDEIKADLEALQAESEGLLEQIVGAE